MNCILTGALFVGLLGVAVSCQDYDNDIKDLQNQITALQSSVADLQSAINSGKVITSVAEDNGGVKITFSDNSSVYISNGADGAAGADGKDGKDGADGKDGSNGKDGADADVWTIGADGYWYVNGELFTDSNWPNGVSANGAAGTQGDKGEKGDTGAAGADGADGLTIAMMPCADEDGWFNLVQLTYDSETETWTQEIVVDHYYQFAVPADESGDNTLYAIWDGNTLTLYNVKTPVYDANGDLAGYEYIDYVLELGNPLGSVAFVPDWLDKVSGYPTTAPFVSMNSYLDEEKVDGDGYFEAQEGLGISNTVGLVYRLNPSNAYVEDANYEFINRNVKVRSGSAVEGDEQTLLNVVSASHYGETVTVTASLNTNAFSEEGYDFAALRVWVGTDQVVTSDYIVVKNENTDTVPYIVDKTETAKGMDEDAATEFNRRTKGINDSQEENSNFIHGFVTDPVYDETAGWSGMNLEFAYDEELDLSDYVGLYSYEALDYVESLGITPTFVYTLPKSFLIDNVEQQTSVTLEDGVVTAANGTLSVDMFPVVRVDAYITVDGTDYLVASSYILIHVTSEEELDPVWFPLNGFKVETEDDVETNSAGDDDSINPTETNHTIANYRLLNGNEEGSVQTYFLNLTGAEFLADVQTLGFEDLTDFWTYYNKEYFYTITPYDIEGEESCEVEDPAKADWTDMQFYYNGGGVGATPGDGGLRYMHVSPAEFWFGTNVAAEDDDLFFRVGVDYGVLTQHSHTDVTCGVCGGHGAMYMVTLSFVSKNGNAAPDVCFFAFVHIYDACEEFELNPLYKIEDPTAYGLESDDPAVLCKGQLDDSGVWTMYTNVEEHFEGGSIFAQVEAGVDNVTGLVFDWAEAYTYTDAAGDEQSMVDPEYNDGEGGVIVSGDSSVGLAASLTDQYFVANMVYSQVLANGEYCSHDYYIVFENPFVDGEGLADVELEDGIGENTAEAYEQVVIYDTYGELVLSWDADAEGFVISDYAANLYGLDMDNVTITYAADEENGAWAYLQGQIANLDNVILEVDEETGVVTWQNEGTRLQGEYTIYVVATVDFGVATATCTVTVILNPTGVEPATLPLNVL